MVHIGIFQYCSLGPNEKELSLLSFFQALSDILFFNSLDTKRIFGDITHDH